MISDLFKHVRLLGRLGASLRSHAVGMVPDQQYADGISSDQDLEQPGQHFLRADQP